MENSEPYTRPYQILVNVAPLDMLSDIDSALIYLLIPIATNVNI